MISYDEESGYYYFACPHCNTMCQVHKKDIRCTIFRHAVYKKNLSFVDPHATETQCSKWIEDDVVYGCGKPFKFDGESIEKCGYI